MATPGNDNPLNSQINAYNSINNQYLEMNALYASDLKSLVAWMKQDPTHRAGEALWRFQMWVMPDATQSCEYHMALEADALNIANTIRNDITNAQNAYNNMISDIEGKNTAAGRQAAQSLYNALKNIENDLNTPGLTKILGKSGISNLKNYISNITAALYAGSGNYPNWTGPFYIYRNASNAYSQATKSGGKINPAYTSITSAFNNLNQSVSGISSTIQAQMQYLNNNLQQFFGIFKSFFDDFSQLSSYITQKSGPS